jgi:hypothetical protein
MGPAANGTIRRDWLRLATWRYTIRPDCTGELIVDDLRAGSPLPVPPGAPFAALSLAGVEHGIATRGHATQWTPGDLVGVGTFTRVRPPLPPESEPADRRPE